MKSKYISSLIAAMLLAGSYSASAENLLKENNKTEKIKNEQKAAKYNPENTGINVRDRNPGRLTADDQSSSAYDTDLVSKVRASLIQEDDLSFLAQNVKVIAQKGVVTLRGPVKTAEEKRLIGEKAVQVAGLNNVRNELEVSNN